ncbi:hypothetical protein CANARDRAFT_181313, partial [[Candida] arabinofermentans NRRL YB-2248]
KRTKSFTGCYTCRRRKIACDLQRPSCKKCQKSGFVCEGYEVKLRWSQPILFDIYGYQLRSRPNQETEYCQRRSIDFVKYPKSQQYELYDEMDTHLSKLHNQHIPKLSDTPRMLGPFGVFRGSKDRRSAMKRKNKQNVEPIKEIKDKREPKKLDSTISSGNEWLSIELIDAALLTASALNGDTHFLDMFRPDPLYPINGSGSNLGITQGGTISNDNDAFAYGNLGNNNNNKSQFWGGQYSQNQQQQQQQQPSMNRSKTSQQPLQRIDPPIPAHLDNTTGQSPSIPLDSESDTSKFSRTDKEISNNTINIHAGNGARMPKTIMEIKETTPLPRSLAIDKFGIPITSLQVHPTTRYLLNYYIEDVADMMTVIPLPKNPWKFIYFPRAIMAVGELASLGKTSNAKNCLLNALLAVSAFNLQSKFTRGSDEMKYYVDLGIQLRQQATNFLNKCLEEDILQQKYKDVLVAVLSMVTIDVVWGTMSACKIHLDHCEKIIEKKMKVKKKLSNKAVILHRIFSSLKLLQDSTSLENISEEDIFLNENNYRHFIIGSVASSPAANFSTPASISGAANPTSALNSPSVTKGVYNEKITDNGKVRIEYIVNSEEINPADRTVQGSSVANNGIPSFIDITRTSFKPSKNKMEDKIVSSDAIYGLPNSLILMFSEIVHLVRFKKHHDDHNMTLPNFYDELSNQLEFKLLGWRLEWNLTLDDDAGSTPGSTSTPSAAANSNSNTKKQNFISARYEGIYHHVMSFYHALIIYFYRFVEDVNPMYLQERVEKVLHHLNEIQNIVENNKDTSYIIPLFWQGFIAGSEAMTLFLQNGFNLWGQHIAQTGIGTYWNARQIMLEIWRRKNHNAKRSSWVDVLHDWKTNVMLT